MDPKRLVTTLVALISLMLSCFYYASMHKDFLDRSKERLAAEQLRAALTF